LPIKVTRVLNLVNGFLREDDEVTPKGAKALDVFAVIERVEPTADPIELQFWMCEVIRGIDRGKPFKKRVEFKPFISRAAYAQSMEEPTAIEGTVRLSNGSYEIYPVIWLYRDNIYLADRPPLAHEREEIALRAKSLHYKRDAEMRRLREEVANYEGVERFAKIGPKREQIPDDVKLLVWTRDGGVCVRCGATSNLHFDHEIPLVKGGGNHAENIRLLCETCNLKKGDRLV
jgi:hypothetical protein